MIRLPQDFGTRVLDLLEQIDQLQDCNNRKLLLRGLPGGPVRTINRADSMLADLNNIINAAEGWGQLKQSGEWALVIIAKNALRFARETQLGEEIEALLAELETLPPESGLNIVEEIIIGRDERLPENFLKYGLIASQSVAKVLVPRVINGQVQKESGFGSGWIIAPNILITNHHVIEARDRAFENPANTDDLTAQARKATVWFDYTDWDALYVEYPCIELLHADPELDYALLRIADAPVKPPHKPLSAWDSLRILPIPPSFTKGTRLNIIQHPQGGPKRIAIRSNFYVDTDPDSPARIRYLTDTEPGSSGSPVFTDNWQVAALHCASVKVPETMYKGDVVKYNNQGILIHAILDSLPAQIRQEIEKAQHR